MKRNGGALIMVLVLVLITSVIFNLSSFASSPSFSGKGAISGVNSAGTDVSPKRMYYYDPVTGIADPPHFKIEVCRKIDINAPEPEHLPGLGVSSSFDYNTERITVRAFSDDWIKDGFFLSFVWKGPNGKVINNLSEVFVPKPWAVVALWDYWEWVTLWKEMYTAFMSPGRWTVDVYFHWAGQTKGESVPVGSVSFTLEGTPPSRHEFIFNGNNLEWTPPTFDLMTLCQDVDIEAIQFDRMPPIGEIPDRSLIEGNKTVWAYVRFVNDPPKMLDEAFHVVFNFTYEDKTAKLPSPYALTQVLDIPHARTSFAGWDYWSDYYVAAINFNPLLIGMWSGKWNLNIYAYPDWAEMESAVLIGSLHFTISGGGAPEPPRPLPLPSQGLKINVSPQPASDVVEFTILSKNGRVYADNIKINIYDLAGYQVDGVMREDTDSVVCNVGAIRNGAYIYVATVNLDGKTYILRGFIYIRRR